MGHIGIIRGWPRSSHVPVRSMMYRMYVRPRYIWVLALLSEVFCIFRFLWRFKCDLRLRLKQFHWLNAIKILKTISKWLRVFFCNCVPSCLYRSRPWLIGSTVLIHTGSCNVHHHDTTTTSYMTCKWIAFSISDFKEYSIMVKSNNVVSIQVAIVTTFFSFLVLICWIPLERTTLVVPHVSLRFHN